MTAIIHQFLIGNDNFGLLLHDDATGATATIDAGEAEPILAALKQTGWTLTDILVTHHHGDHVDGIPAIKAATGAKVTAPFGDKDRVPLVDVTVKEGDTIKIGTLNASIIDTPGHTAHHIAYYLPDDGVVFAGDTLFSLGCGRVFEGTMEQMHRSVGQFAALPAATRLYCGHEYTHSNARFALAMEPGNAVLQQRAAEVERLRANGEMTCPSTIGAELAANPFLRTASAEIRKTLGMESARDVEVFAELRERKNSFR